MWSYIIPVVSIQLIILLFISPTLPCANAHSVRDDSGKRVINGGTYYIRTNQPGPYDHTPITWSYNATTSSFFNCPLYVIQSNNYNTRAIISSSATFSKYIPLEISIDIKFVDNTPCSTSLSWAAMPAMDSKKNNFYVVAGYELPSYDAGTFRIVDAKVKFQQNVYTLRYCTRDEGCMNVGWLGDGSSPYLAMTMDSNVELDPFYFVLVKF